MRALLTGVVAIMGAAVIAVAAQDPKLVDEGKKLYTANKCADCHTIAGKGGRLMKDALDSAGKTPAADIKKWLTNPAEMEAKLEKPPKLKMSSKKYAFKDPEVEALTAYMLTLKK